MFDVDLFEGKDALSDLGHINGLWLIRINDELGTLFIIEHVHSENGRCVWHGREESDGFEEIERIILTDISMI